MVQVHLGPPPESPCSAGGFAHPAPGSSRRRPLRVHAASTRERQVVPEFALDRELDPRRYVGKLPQSLLEVPRMDSRAHSGVFGTRGHVLNPVVASAAQRVPGTVPSQVSGEKLDVRDRDCTLSSTRAISPNAASTARAATAAHLAEM